MVRTTLLGAAAALLFSSAAQAQLQPVTDWSGANPSNIKFDVYVPQKVAQSPAIVLAVSGSRQGLVRQGTPD